MGSDVVTTSIFHSSDRGVFAPLERLSSLFPLSPSIIGATISVTIHGVIGAALLHYSDRPLPIESGPEISFVEFVPVGINSAHPRTISDGADLSHPSDAQRLQRGERGFAQLQDRSDTDSTTKDSDVATPISTRALLTHDTSLETSIPTTAMKSVGGSVLGVAKARYEAAVLSRLEGAKRYPSKAIQRRLEGRLILDLRLRADGGVSSVSISRSSGLPIFDQEALRMVTRAMPFPPAPAELDPSELSFVIPIAFRLGL